MVVLADRDADSNQTDQCEKIGCPGASLAPPDRARRDRARIYLVYLEGEDLPYLGHPVVHTLSFAEDDDPWLYYVNVDKGLRKVFPMPIGMGVYRALEDQLGMPDPDGKRAEAVKLEDDYHCGISPTPRPVEPPAFPGIPRAIIEAAEYPR